MKKDLAHISETEQGITIAPSLAKKLEMFLDKQSVTPVEDWLDGATAEDLLGVSTRTLQHYRDSGILPYSKVGNKIYYKRSDLGAMIERYYQKGGEYGNY